MSLHLARNVMHFASQVAWAKSLLLLPLATVFAIEFTAPAWVTLFAVVFLGEKLTRSRLGSVLLGFVGVLIIMRPGVAAFQPAALLVLVAALGFAAVSVTTKKLTDTESTFSILFWMSLMQLPMNLAGSDLFFLTRLEQPHLLPAAGVAITGVAAHFCLTNAFRYGDALVVVPFDFLRIPFIAVIGWMMYGEPLDALVFVGAGVIVVGVIWNLRTEARQKPPPV
jgi:drug/metabolite transporter (DMT)-like permease